MAFHAVRERNLLLIIKFLSEAHTVELFIA